MGNTTFKFTLDDFAPQPVIVQHMDIDFDVFDTKTEVTSVLKFKTRDQPLTQLALNAQDLEIHEVMSKGELEWNYDKDADKLFITFKTPLPPNTESFVKTVSTAFPTKNVLEGLYYDETPEGAPPQQITQCQQWGFQRIVPSIDEMNAKCTYNTTITADKRYTNLLTNGDITRGPEEVSEGRVKVWYDNTVTPMATYLFFLGVGTYATFVREFEYPDGTTFNMELLCPPGTDQSIAAKSLEMLFDGILWIYLYTGRDRYKNIELADKLYDLVYARERLKKEGKDLTQIRQQLQTLSAESTWGYKYTGTVYREIGMQNSNFGGMENVGNTTISTNRLLPHPDASDGVLEYVQRVKTHEFYHNLNGSEVTGMSPFEIWLNEAVTVHHEKMHHAFTFGEEYSRLQEVLGIISPDGGVLQLDTGALANPIIPQGFNSPDELITAVTYVKAPEFVGMIEMILGKENFCKALADYHEKFKHSNATTSDWLDCMQAYTDIDVHEFAHAWLYKTGYPVVHVTRTYDKETTTYELTLEQEARDDGTVWQFPFIAALCDQEGNEIAQQQVFVDEDVFTLVFENIDQEPAFLSLNREYSFFGKLIDQQASEEELFLQVRTDNNLIARYFAFYTLWDKEKTRLLLNPQTEPREELIDLLMELLQDETLMENAGTQFLARFESVEDPAFTHDYQGIYEVRKKISNAFAQKYKEPLLKLYTQAQHVPRQDTFMKQLRVDIASRQIKNLALAFLAKLDTPDIHELIKQQYQQATVAGERNLAVTLYLESSAPDRNDFLVTYKEFAKQTLLRWETFLSIVGRSDTPDVITLIQEVESMPEFRIEQANDNRALYLGFAMNRRLSLLTAKGRAFMQEVLIRLAAINEFTTVHILKQFAHIDDLVRKEDRAATYGVLVVVEKAIRDKKNDIPMSYNNLKRLLETCTKAKADFEAQ